MAKRDRRTLLAGVSGGIAGALVVALVLTVVPVRAGNGDPVILGQVNKAIRSTWVASRGPSVMKFSNTLRGTAVELKTAADVPPMIVYSSARVEGLNVDLLDGLDSGDFAALAHDHDGTYAVVGHDHAGVYAEAGHDHDADYLGLTARAADSDLLDGLDSAAFAAVTHHHDAAYAAIGHDHDADYLAIDGKADDADLLDGNDSSYFATAAHGHGLGDLTDVMITSVATGELVRWSGSAWVNATLAEAGIASSGHDHAGVYAAAGHNHAWSDLTSGVPAGLNDGDDDTLGALSCPEGQIPEMTASGWDCGADDGSSDADTLDGIDSGAFVGGRAAFGNGLPSLGFGCLHQGGHLLAFARDGSAVCTANGNEQSFADSGQSLGSSAGHSGALGDLDGDGDLDAVVVNYDQANAIWINNGTGSFTATGQTLGTGSSYDVDLGDLDGDGDLDIWITNRLDMPIWMNDGTGAFTTGQTLGTDWGSATALGDFDGDGDLDAFVGRYYAQGDSKSSNLVYLNDGSGTFSNSGQSLGDRITLGVTLGDLDGDGDLDAYAGNASTGNRIYLNDGNASFTATAQTLGTAQTQGVALADFDGDGDLDIYDANNGPDVVWLNSDGTGTAFVDSGSGLGSSGGFGVALGDLDGDGDLDAYLAEYDDDEIRLNNGSGVFSDAGVSLDPLHGYSVSLGDLDGDGDLDAFVVNENGGDTVWFD